MIDFILDVLDDLLAFSPGLRRIRDRSQEWTGTVETKKTSILSRHGYIVIFRTDDGRRKKVRLDRKEDFDIYQEGRRYAKKAGQVLPDTQPVA